MGLRSQGLLGIIIRRLCGLAKHGINEVMSREGLWIVLVSRVYVGDEDDISTLNSDMRE
jgi:hypothetical protein